MQETPKSLDKKRADEKLLVSEMIALYCRKQHKTPKGQLCPACQELQDYALARIDKCPFMETRLSGFPSILQHVSHTIAKILAAHSFIIVFATRSPSSAACAHKTASPPTGLLSSKWSFT